MNSAVESEVKGEDETRQGKKRKGKKKSKVEEEEAALERMVNISGFKPTSAHRDYLR